MDRVSIRMVKEPPLISEEPITGPESAVNILGEYLREKYSLADHRPDPDYSSWNEGFKRWENQRAAVEENVDALMKSDGE